MGRIFENSGSERQADARLQNTSGSDNIFGDMFNSMHQSMQEMMKGFMGAASSGQDHGEQRNEDGKIVHGGGELVVIKSGPGFHEEKKYMLVPDADIEKILDSNMNDMFGKNLEESREKTKPSPIIKENESLKTREENVEKASERAGDAMQL